MRGWVRGWGGSRACTLAFVVTAFVFVVVALVIAVVCVGTVDGG